MNELTDLFQRIVTLLDQANIQHMIAGSFASTYYGAVRMTQDIDIANVAPVKRFTDSSTPRVAIAPISSS